MAQVNLANERHGTDWVCQTATFDEGEECECGTRSSHTSRLPPTPSCAVVRSLGQV